MYCSVEPHSPCPTMQKRSPAELRLEVVIGQMDRQLQRLWRQMLDRIGERLDLSRLADLLEAGQLEVALAEARSMAAGFASGVSASYLTGAQTASQYIGTRLSRFVRFDSVHELAVQHMRQNELRLVAGIVQEQRNVINAALTDGLRRGINPRETAREIRVSLGLTQRQFQAVQNYRRLLESGDTGALYRTLRDRRFDRTVRRAIKDGEPLSPSQIERMVSRYRERALKHRAEVIARTESLRSVHEGTQAAFQQAIAAGTLSKDQLMQRWVTARDSRVRDSHDGMHGQIRPMGEPFVTDFGNLLRYPGDSLAPASETIQCRCAVATRIVKSQEL